ncbi:peptide chain release factor N(5)-glutamine methyltransferase [Flavobacterium okayamense]|uniref:Release factor glutamine methyltransferase n=1 Tax=Flavobacterium okayamense TaxID=2830782 RepID=A0ABM7S9R3_9FLAO|nr:peptide chain release factor N(5)-glutamine methyltransferase [Flavobacterium okayamense]BCY29699.1 release factor glutamine methyltransferase [Flavobacterium okayamense]
MRLKELKIHFQNHLQSIYDKEEIDSFFFMITEKLYNFRRIDFTLNPDFEITNTSEWETIISELKQEKPIQYILGEAWFYGLPFKVNENTLIPRSETEELVEWIIESQKSKVKSQKINILDIGTGSGCIPISLKSNLPKAEVFAIDVSEKALEVANQNAKDNNVEVNFIQTDILNIDDLLSLRAESRSLPKIDIIVSNPPYVRYLEKEEIKKNVLDYEPHLALFVEDNDALLFYRKIAQLAKISLQPNGLLFFEINQYLGKETVELLENLGFKNIELRKDLKGNYRMVKCSFNQY